MFKIGIVNRGRRVLNYFKRGKTNLEEVFENPINLKTLITLILIRYLYYLPHLIPQIIFQPAGNLHRSQNQSSECSYSSVLKKTLIFLRFFDLRKKRKKSK